LASGDTHDKLGMTVAAGLAGLALFFDLASLLPIGLGCGLGTLFFSPDLDCPSKPYKRWSLARVIWIPYQRLVKHRSPISHSPIIGTAGRIVYLVVVVGLLYLLAVAIGLTGLPQFSRAGLLELSGRLLVWWWAIAGFILGLELAALLHLGADQMLPGQAKSRGKKQSKRKAKR
jgi:uncharacterized metal-binding protein